MKSLLVLLALASVPDGGAALVRAPDAGAAPTLDGARDDGGAPARAADAGVDVIDGGARDGGPSDARDDDGGPERVDAGVDDPSLALIEHAFGLHGPAGRDDLEDPPVLEPLDVGSADAGPAPSPAASSSSSSEIPVSATLVLILIFSFFVSRVFQRVLGERLLSSGVEYLLVGFLVGPQALELLDPRGLATLMPVVSLLLGFSGLLLGLQLRHHKLPGGAFRAGVFIALTTAAGTAALFYVVLPLVLTIDDDARLYLALAIGASAAAVSVPAVTGGAEFFRARGRLKDLLESAAQAGNVVAVVGGGIALVLDRAAQDGIAFGPESSRWIGASVALGVGSGLLFRIFLGREREGTTLFLATTALITFASGMAAGLGVSPLLLNLVAGVVVSMLLPDTQSLLEKLRPLERPALTTFAIFAGAMWTIESANLLFLALGYVVVRRVMLVATAGVGQAVVPGAPHVPGFGNGLLVQGGFAVAVAVNFAQVRPEQASAALTAVLVALMVQDVIGLGALRRLFGDQGELGTADVLANDLPVSTTNPEGRP